MLTPTTYILIGAVLASLFWLAVFIPISIWAGWPRKRERELKKELERLRSENEGRD